MRKEERRKDTDEEMDRQTGLCIHWIGIRRKCAYITQLLCGPKSSVGHRPGNLILTASL